MLIRFKVGNYLSFNEVQELSMIAGATKIHPNHLFRLDDVDILKLAAIYGANASGKSNFIKAIREAKRFISGRRSMGRRDYFRLNKENKKLASLFEFEFEINCVKYSYGFEIILNEQKLKSEWLYELSSENRIIFQRTENVITHEFNESDSIRLNVYIEDMKQFSNRLFLNEMSKKMRPDEGDLSIFFKVYNWFKESLLVIDTEEFNSPIDQDNEASELMHKLGTGITSTEYQKMDSNVDDIFPGDMLDSIYTELKGRKGNGKNEDRSIPFGDNRVSLSDNDELIFERLVFKHGNPNVCFTFDEESDGTRRLYKLRHILLERNDNITYIIDELDLRLHPQLTYRFIEHFVEKMNGNRNQLIFTTHESCLMDFELLRRDEIWFVDKNNDVSSLYSLEEFAERSDRKIDKAYLEGRYGGIPIFSTLFPVQKEGI